VAQGIDGQRLITDLSQLMKLDIAASTNKTGISGDWTLEDSTGQVSYRLPAVQYIDDLATTQGSPWTRTIRPLEVTVDGSPIQGDGNPNQVGNLLTSDITGFIYLGGTVSKTGGGELPFVTKFSLSGDKLWTKPQELSTSAGSRALTTGSDGSVYLAGYLTGTTSDGEPVSGPTDAFVTRVTPDGTKIWTKRIGGSGNDSIAAITTGRLTKDLDDTKNAYIAGTTSSATFEGVTTVGGSDVFLTKLQPDGTKIWTQLIGTSTNDNASAITTGPDGSVYVAGNTASKILDGEVNGPGSFITKFSPDGKKIWTRFNSPDEINSLTTGTDGSLYSLDRSYLKKLSVEGAEIWRLYLGSSTRFRDPGDLTTGTDGFLYGSNIFRY
jgi:hypothetical protein